LKVGISIALVGATVGQFVAGSDGPGTAIPIAEGQFDTTRVFAALVMRGLLSTRLLYAIELTGYKTIDECILAPRSGRVDAKVISATIGFRAAMGFSVNPTRDSPRSSMRGSTFNRGIGTIRRQMISGLALNGVALEQIPAELSF
jgi:hypothetical protein